MGGGDPPWPPVVICRHFVATVMAIPAAAIPSEAEGATVQGFYESRGLVVIGSVVDGDCGIDVMNMMLDQPQSIGNRTQLRTEISDYLMDRAGEPWMQDVLVVCEEISGALVKRSRSDLSAGADLSRNGVVDLTVNLAAVADPVPLELQAAMDEADAAIVVQERIPTDDEMAAMRWASNLRDDGLVRNLVRDLPRQVVEEQIIKHRQASIPVAAVSASSRTIHVSRSPTLQKRFEVAKALSEYCKSHGWPDASKLPPKRIAAWAVDRIRWTASKQTPKAVSQKLRRWVKQWNVEASVVAEFSMTEAGVPQSRKRKQKEVHSGVAEWQRQRATGAGARRHADIVGRELYEWFVGLRYAIDWKSLASQNRTCGKRCLARFPRSIVKQKVMGLLEDHAFAVLMNGSRVVNFHPTPRWLKQWEHDYGLSMRKANRKYEVPRGVLQERLHIGWANIFRVRKLMVDLLGYEPTILNWDQSPYHNNETGSQNKPVLGVKGSIIPIVEGKDDVRARWTANLTTISHSRGILKGQMPPVECLFKAAVDGPVKERLTEYIRSRGFPSWFSVACSPRGSYREDDVINFLSNHLEKWAPGRDWRIILADDYAAHKTATVRRFCWNRGYILLLHGGGATPVVQTVDTDLNEHVRRAYARLETELLLDKMRNGVVVPKASHEECLELMRDVLSDPAIHTSAVAGFKKTGITNDLYGAEDVLICREAATFWNEPTKDGFANMREKINKELSYVADEIKSGSLRWNKECVARLIVEYPRNKHVDAILKRIGDDAGVDGLHGPICDGDNENGSNDGESSDSDADDAAVIEKSSEPVTCASDPSAVADPPAVKGLSTSASLSVEQAEILDTSHAILGGLQEALAACQRIGAVASAQTIEREIRTLLRSRRAMIAEDDAVADAFLKRRQAEAAETTRKRRLADHLNQTVYTAKKAKEEHLAAVAALKKVKDDIKRSEAHLECQHAMKSFTPHSLGAGLPNGGGVNARKMRFEVLDRMARIGSGLSPAQRNDFAVFKQSWDAKMLDDYRGEWAMRFLSWIQNVLDKKESNAFSLFVYDESCRLFHGTIALHVP